MIFDAHNHLQDLRLDPWREDLLSQCFSSGQISGMVVNGTSPADWPQVAALARRFPSQILPSFGLHPWRVHQAPADWLETLRACLDEFPQAGLGEIGLDRWVHEPSIAIQRPAFELQWQEGCQRGRVITLHCLRAWEDLMPLLRAMPKAPRGFLLHSFGGPERLIEPLVELGAYFSISPYFAHPHKARNLQIFGQLPLQRLLIETDSPDMSPPAIEGAQLLPGDQAQLNHPANLGLSLQLLAGVCRMDSESLSRQLADNHRRLFGDCRSLNAAATTTGRH